MNESLLIKKQLYQELQALIDQRIANAQNAMQAASLSKQNQTKSSAGDKFETGRAMMQAEEERSKVQLLNALALDKELATAKRKISDDTVQLGSLVFTNQSNYFISVGLGKIVVAGTIYYAISLASPIGQLLFGKKQGEKVIFRGKTIKVKEIS